MLYQISRLSYQFDKLPSIRDGIYPHHGGNIEFELFAFFEICYHLKDWIKEDINYKKFNDVEIFVKNSPALRISADICNRLKHKNLKDKNKIVQNKRSHAPLGPFIFLQSMTIGPIPSMARVALPKATIETERGQECCYSLAEECIREWNRYFEENNIDTTFK